MRYERVFFAQEHAAEEAMQILESQGKDAAMDHLLQWWYPGEHETHDEPASSDHDRRFARRIDENTLANMTWNPGIPYIALEIQYESA